jgi:hypothetical protein
LTTGTVRQIVHACQVATRRIFLSVPMLVVFQWRVGLSTVNPYAAPSMLVGDWTTYIVGPNYLRSAHLLTFPLGAAPGYLHPVGSSLANSDSAPLLLPVYRLLLFLTPGRPIQLVGLLLFGGYFLTYAVAFRFARALLVGHHPDADRQDAVPDRRASLSITAIALGAALVVSGGPTLATRVGHSSLMQQWILVLAVIFSLERTVLGLHGDETPRRELVHLGVLTALASSIHPYFLPMVVFALLPVVLRRSDGWARIATRGATVLVAGFIPAIVFGYLGGGKRSTNVSFGEHNANLLASFNPYGSSRMLKGWPVAGQSWEGFGFIGLGALLLLAVSAVVLLASGDARRFARKTGPLLKTGAAALFLSALPALRLYRYSLANFPVVMGDNPIGKAVSSFRTNGRIVWTLTFIIILLLVALLLRHVRQLPLLVVLFLAAGILQVRDAPFLRPSRSDPVLYRSAHGVVAEAKRRGAKELRVYPPYVLTDCLNPELDFHRTAPVVLAAAVLGVSADTGYPARGDNGYLHQICETHAQEFESGVRYKSVAYLLATARPHAGLSWCKPIIEGMQLCMV